MTTSNKLVEICGIAVQFIGTSVWIDDEVSESGEEENDAEREIETEERRDDEYIAAGTASNERSASFIDAIKILAILPIILLMIIPHCARSIP